MRPVDMPLLRGDASRLRALGWRPSANALERALRTLWHDAVALIGTDRHEDPGHRRHRLPRPRMVARAGAPRMSCVCWCARAPRASAFPPASSSPPATSPTARASARPWRAATRSCTPRRWSRSWRRPRSSTASTSAGSRTCSPRPSRRRQSGGCSTSRASSPSGRPRRGRGGMLDETRRAGATASGSTTTSAPRRSPTAAARAAIAAGAPLRVVYPGVIYGPGELTEGNIVVRHILDLGAQAAAGAARQAGAALELRLRRRRGRGAIARALESGAGRRPLRARRRERHLGGVLRLVGEPGRHPRARRGACRTALAKARRRGR